MAVTKVTYSLKPETADRVRELAVSWGVPKSEVIRRVVDRAILDEPVGAKKETPLDVFLRVQASSRISRRAVDKFNEEVRRERRASKRG